MRLERLRIPLYRNLRNFDVSFSQDVRTTVVMGRNGSGKSNLFEAIVEIFRELDASGPPPFAYDLTYFCRGRRIEIDADPGRRSGRIRVVVDGQRLTQAIFRSRLNELLPNNVFAYYSGWSNRLEQQFERPTRRHYESVLNSPDGELPLRRLFFCRKEYSQLVLLVFFLQDSEKTRDLVRQFLSIESFNYALFVLKRPWWRGSGAPSSLQEDEGDERFWFARGAFKGFLTRLWEASIVPIRSDEPVARDVRRKAEMVERQFMFLPDSDALSKLAGSGTSAKSLFGYLESLFLCDLVDEVRVAVARVDGSQVRFTQLSEGEQQLLTVLGLLMFTQEDESLYLLDEPDTHLNPVWIYRFLDLIDQSVPNDKGHLLILTHNPLMVGALRREEVRVLRSEPNRTFADEPEYDPIGLGVEGLLKSELYGLRSSLAPELLAKLDEQYRLLGAADPTSDETLRLQQLSYELNNLSLVTSHPNPYFQEFAAALARTRVGLPVEARPTEELADELALSDEILAEVLLEDDLNSGEK